MVLRLVLFPIFLVAFMQSNHPLPVPNTPYNSAYSILPSEKEFREGRDFAVMSNYMHRRGKETMYTPILAQAPEAWGDHEVRPLT